MYKKLASSAVLVGILLLSSIVESADSESNVESIGNIGSVESIESTEEVQPSQETQSNIEEVITIQQPSSENADNDRFIPSTQISEDLSVSFPIDI